MPTKFLIRGAQKASWPTATACFSPVSQADRHSSREKEEEEDEEEEKEMEMDVQEGNKEVGVEDWVEEEE